MLIEDILLLLLLGLAVFFIGIPLARLVRYLIQLIPVRKDPVLEARKRLEVAEKEIEVAKINKRVENIYSHLYEDVLSEDEDEQLQEEKRHK